MVKLICNLEIQNVDDWTNVLTSKLSSNANKRWEVGGAPIGHDFDNRSILTWSSWHQNPSSYQTDFDAGVCKIFTLKVKSGT